MRPTRLTMKFAASAALSLALGAAMLATSLPARAEEDASLDKKIFRGIMEGLGLRRDGEAINYQERAPLVIPPGRTLPPPEKSGAVVDNNPAWPKDADIKRRKLEAKQQRDRNVSDDREREQNPLRDDQLTPGGNPRTSPRETQTSSTEASPYGYGGPLSPSQLGYKGNLLGKMFGKDDDDVSKFTGEPARTTLTEPPPGYQTPSPDQPYGVTGKTAPKALNPTDRVEPTR